MKSRWLFWTLFISLLLVDQLVKLWARNAASDIPGHTFMPLWPNVFELTLTFNEGVAFGMFQGKAIFLTPIAVLIAAGAAFYSWKHPRETLWAHTGMALVASGALGNLYDRLIHGRVTDMFHIRAINFPVFNVADICITLGAATLILTWSAESIIRNREAHPNRSARIDSGPDGPNSAPTNDSL